jgi:hypothetical protein
MNTPISHRRDFLKSASCGFGYLALAGLSAQAALKDRPAGNPLAARDGHFPAKAKRVIFMFMQGAPSHVDTFDYKPELIKAGGKKIDGEENGKKISGNLLAPQFEFKPHGKSGLMISSLFPHLSQHADDLCLLNGMHTNSPAHPQATIMAHTGSTNFVRPSLGSWVTYGLGSTNNDLPGFVTINPLDRLGGAQNYGSAFLPASYQGTRVLTRSDAMPDIANPRLSPDAQRRQLDFLQGMNRNMLKRVDGNTEIEGVIQSFELAYRMQTAVPGVMDLAVEPENIKEMYGLNNKVTNDFGTQCLMARRLAESGVRFIQVTKSGWDQHNGLKKKLGENCAAIDQPIAALLTDLKMRGMLEDTLVVWGGEFGRSPEAQSAQGDGRRHNNRGFTMWMAGGGVKGGIRYGATDEVGRTAVENTVHTHDLHATILHLMGLDHKQLTYRYAGRDFRLTDVYGDVVTGIFA